MGYFFKASKYKKQFVTNAGFRRGSSSKYSYRPTVHADEKHIDYQVASFGVEQLKAAHDKPFFLAVGIVKPHLPFDAPKRFFDQLPEDITPPQMISNDMEDIPGVGKALCKRKKLIFTMKITLGMLLDAHIWLVFHGLIIILEGF